MHLPNISFFFSFSTPLYTRSIFSTSAGRYVSRIILCERQWVWIEDSRWFIGCARSIVNCLTDNVVSAAPSVISTWNSFFARPLSLSLSPPLFWRSVFNFNLNHLWNPANNSAHLHEFTRIQISISVFPNFANFLFSADYKWNFLPIWKKDRSFVRCKFLIFRRNVAFFHASRWKRGNPFLTRVRVIEKRRENSRMKRRIKW